MLEFRYSVLEIICKTTTVLQIFISGLVTFMKFKATSENAFNDIIKCITSFSDSYKIVRNVAYVEQNFQRHISCYHWKVKNYFNVFQLFLCFIFFEEFSLKFLIFICLVRLSKCLFRAECRKHYSCLSKFLEACLKFCSQLVNMYKIELGY